LVELADSLFVIRCEDEANTLLDEGTAIFERLAAVPWLEGARAARTEVAA
jgi:hypothetical protein